MRDLDYLALLSHEYPNAAATAAEIINYKALLGMPKGTEYFFSDLHGEHRAFIHMLRSCSGNIKNKIKETFGDSLPEEELQELGSLIAYPEHKLRHPAGEPKRSLEWQEQTIRRLLQVAYTASHKWNRRTVRKYLPTAYAHVIDELMHSAHASADKAEYYSRMMQAVLETDAGYDCIERLCTLIRALLMDELHIIGDIFDRGPRADLIIDELMNFDKVDIQWGNHDVSWMGAAAGNDACIATVLRIATAYNCFDVLEDGYGINLRPLSMFAEEVYSGDPCECFNPHLLDENLYDDVDPGLAARICKAISVIEFKL
ncbi:MAG: fructose-1,6-bisphosphatase, partial [Oscillospiraceae bacterium]|nr:fructose-1,6-bisphosphatase [Oscillospiraceae bacterium]